jgi:hypothetical protein
LDVTTLEVLRESEPVVPAGFNVLPIVDEREEFELGFLRACLAASSENSRDKPVMAKGQGQLVTWPLRSPAGSGPSIRRAGVGRKGGGLFHPFSRVGSHLLVYCVRRTWRLATTSFRNRSRVELLCRWFVISAVGGEFSDLFGHGCYWNQRVAASLASPPRRKASSRDRSAQKGCQDGEWVRLAKSDKTSCFRRTANRIA